MQRHCLVYGANGALGRAMKVTGIDFTVNAEAHTSITLEKSLTTQQISSKIHDEMNALLQDSKLDCIVNVAGGWAGGNLLDNQLLQNVDLMYNQSVSTSIISARLAALYLRNGGLLVLTGAGAATHGTPSMIAYGMAKAAVHQLVKSCAGPDSGIPAGGKVIGILPVMLDTPMNRKFMGDGDTSTWTPLEHISEKVYEWADGTQVQSGELFKVVTEHSKTQFLLVE